MTNKRFYNRRGGAFTIAAVVNALGVVAMLLVGSPAWAAVWTTVTSPNDVPGNS
jgi:hypothetical protein